MPACAACRRCMTAARAGGQLWLHLAPPRRHELLRRRHAAPAARVHLARALWERESVKSVQQIGQPGRVMPRVDSKLHVLSPAPAPAPSALAAPRGARCEARACRRAGGMEVVSWGTLTAELGVSYARVVGWNDAPALAAAARSAVAEQAAQDAEHYSSDDECADADGGPSNSHSRAAAALRRAPVLWRRHGVDVRSVLNVDDLSPLEDEARAACSAPCSRKPPLNAAPRARAQVVAAARSGFVASDLVVGNITNPCVPGAPQRAPFQPEL